MGALLVLGLSGAGMAQGQEQRNLPVDENGNYILPQQWELDLPTMAGDVERAVLDDPNPYDQSPNVGPGRWAAREVMIQFAEALSGKKRTELVTSKGVTADRVALYLSSKRAVVLPTPEVMTKAAALARDPAFQKWVLKKLVAPEWQAVYFRTPHWARLVRDAELASPEAQKTRAELASERRPGVDRSLFGITLGEPLELPRCGPLQLGPGPSTCLRGNDAAAALHTWMVADEVLPGTQLAPVLLGRDRCPEWVDGCAVWLTLKNGLPVAAKFITSRATDSYVEGALVEKYGARPKSTSHEVRCVSSARDYADGTRAVTRKQRTVSVRRWQLPGLSVIYFPGCTGGEVTVSTGVHGRIVQQAEAKKPKM